MGVLQGETLSPILFILYISDSLKRKYCELNELIVNTSKTKLLKVFASGRSRKDSDKFHYKGDQVESVNSFIYLGVYFTTSLQGDAATNSALTKSKLAAGTVINILSKLKANSWKGKIQVYNSLSKSIILYLSHLWCLMPKNLDRHEAAQMYFFKKLLQFPKCTSG
ncbi:Protein of unknown function [Cotesia congregata]|uniref:Reverse transcriptase domain-containing protein n=1 Tax=Cotesia congregata TaxID=51543 RepID=A0A8J2HJI8_COTCN|nr:Protein of unknown function [Cotesia congregata]